MITLQLLLTLKILDRSSFDGPTTRGQPHGCTVVCHYLIYHVCWSYLSSILLQIGKDSPKALPNDPQRQGNIWHRYEQLENMTKSLAGVNQQMVMEKAKHQRVCANQWAFLKLTDLCRAESGPPLALQWSAIACQSNLHFSASSYCRFSQRQLSD